MGSIIHVGIDFVTRNLGPAVQGVRQFAGAFSEAHREATIFANGMQANERKVQRSAERMRKALAFDWGAELRRQTSAYGGDMNRAMENITRMFDNTWRDIANRFNSIVMGSVALSMSGIGIQNVGRNISRFMGEATRQATEFELAMKQVAYYGGVAEKDLRRLRQQALKLGREMPVSPSEVAASTVSAMKTGYQNVDDALLMSEYASILQFLSFGGLDGQQAMKFLNFARQLTGTQISEVPALADMLTKAVDVSALELEGLFRAMMSSRSATANLNLDAPQLLALLGGMGNVLNERGAGESLNVFSRGFLQALGAEVGTKRGDLFRQLGIDLDQDILSILDQIVTRSMELWPDHFERMEKRMDIFGNDAGTLLNAYEANLKNGELTLKEMERQIREAAGRGYAQDTLAVFMDSMWGVQERLRSIREEFFILFGTAFAPGLNLVLETITNLIGRLNEFLEAHPRLAKFAGYFLGIGSAIAIATGGLMIFGGMVVGVYASVMAFTANLVRSSKVMKLFDSGVNTTGDLLRRQLIGPLRRASSALLRFSLASGLVYLAWKYDILGLQTHLKKFWNYVTTSYKDAQGVLDKFRTGSLDEFTTSFENLADGSLAKRLSQFMVLASAVAQAWRGNTLSEDAFLKLQEAGLLPMLEMILDIKYAAGQMWKGFIEGASVSLGILNALLSPLYWIYERVVAIGQYFGIIEYESDGVSDKWRTMGKILGGILGTMLALKIATRAWSALVFRPIRGLIGLGRGTYGWFRGGGPGRMVRGMGGGIGRGVRGAGRWMFSTPETRYGARVMRNMIQRKSSYIPMPHQMPNLTNMTAQQRRMIGVYQTYGGGRYLPRRDGDLVGGRGFRGRLSDMWYGHRMLIQQTSTGRYYQSRQGLAPRFLTRDEIARHRATPGGLRTGRGLRASLSRVGGRLGNLLNLGLLVGDVASVAGAGRGGGIGGFFKNLGKGAGGLFRGLSRGVGQMAATLGKSLLKGLGKVLLRGLPFIFKLGLRAIPFLGWALLIWDAIRLIWTNWDWLKNAGKKAWDWISNFASKAWNATVEYFVKEWNEMKDDFGYFFDWLKDQFVEVWDEGWRRFREKFSGMGDFILDQLFGDNEPKKEAARVGWKAGWKVGTRSFLGGTMNGIIPDSHVGSKVRRGGVVNLAPGEVVLRDDTVKEFESLVRAQKQQARKPSSEPAPISETRVVIEKGAVVVQMANASQAEIKKAAEQMFQEFLRKVEAQNMRHYRPSRAR